MITAKEYTHAPNKVQAIKMPDNLNDLTDEEDKKIIAGDINEDRTNGKAISDLVNLILSI